MKVKVLLDKNEDELDAHIALEKALNLHTSGDIHIRESFDDPAMVDLSQRMNSIHEDIYQDMIREINEELDKEFE